MTEAIPVETGDLHFVDQGPGYEHELEVEIQVIDSSFWTPASA